MPSVVSVIRTLLPLVNSLYPPAEVYQDRVGCCNPDTTHVKVTSLNSVIV